MQTPLKALLNTVQLESSWKGILKRHFDGNSKDHDSLLPALCNHPPLTPKAIVWSGPPFLYSLVPLFPQVRRYVFCRSGEKGPGVEGPSRPDRVNGP